MRSLGSSYVYETMCLVLCLICVWVWDNVDDFYVYEYETMWMTFMCMSMRQCWLTMCVNVYLTCGFYYYVCCETMWMIILCMWERICYMWKLYFLLLSHVEENKIASIGNGHYWWKLLRLTFIDGNHSQRKVRPNFCEPSLSRWKLRDNFREPNPSPSQWKLGDNFRKPKPTEVVIGRL
jgi:hypothetical protein